MFENIIGQNAIALIKQDLENDTLPPSILFAGPEASAKGTAALELARILSCEMETALWNCPCLSCAHHRNLSHPDLLVLGPRIFQAEIAACKSVYLSEPESVSTKMLFLRSVRKLLLRFSPVVWEGDHNISKLNKFIEPVLDKLEEFCADQNDIQKISEICSKIYEACKGLETEGISGTIHTSHIRHASGWLRMGPNGRRKTLIIENAEKMNDAARNSLLKILEEPPATASIVLTSTNYRNLPPTILSRLRVYHFSRRSKEDEASVLKRIFRYEKPQTQDSACDGENPILVFQNTFLSVSRDSLYPAAAYFLSSIAASAIILSRQRNAGIPADAALVSIGKYCAPIAEQAHFNKHDTDIKTITSSIMKAADKFESRSMFPVFISLLYSALSKSLACENNAEAIACREVLKKYAEEARSAVEIYNQTPLLALERLAIELRGGLSFINKVEM
ncbi:MAG: DNA polymerase III [Spirochaetaceae bacterium]|jgi:DNA polymerase-3 subunit gamma/tau|nr:DNA polymerase III [Spirochaetaceae bacterium]